MERVRSDTDRQVLTALVERGRLTRADLAAVTGVSKPTASEAVRRLVASGTVVEAGLKEGGRGRVGVFYELAPRIGLALAVDAGPDGVVAEVVDARGDVRHRAERRVTAPASPADLQGALADVIDEACAAAGSPLPARALSIADPVDRHTARLVHLAGSPFVDGEADLADLVGPDGVIDNDVHWAATAELRDGAVSSSFAYVYLGPGLGAALIDEGRLVTGSRGLAGEIAHVLTIGPNGRAMRALDALGALGLSTPGGSALDVAGLRRRWQTHSDGQRGTGAGFREDLVALVAGVLASTVALLEPADVVVGGPWADLEGLLPALAEATRGLAPHEIDLRPALVPDATRRGVRAAATDLARATLLGHR